MTTPIQIKDTVTFGEGGGAQAAAGSMAQRLLQTGFNINALRPMQDKGNFRANAVLRKDEWIQYDTALIEVARKRLIIVGDMLNAGMRYNLPNALGKTRLEWETVSDFNPASVSMSGISEGQNDRVTFELTGMPIPIIHKDFNINLRALAASRTTGEPLDTIQAQLSGRIVAETVESIVFNGASILGANNPIYGLRTQPNRNTGNLVQNWLTATGEQIVGDVLSMIEALVADNMYGPYNIYVSAAVYTHLGDDYKANSDRTILERILAIPGISAVRPTKDIPNDEVVMLQMTSDVAEMVDGIQPTTVQWESHAGFVTHFKILTIMIPRMRNDQANQSGIAHFSVGS